MISCPQPFGSMYAPLMETTLVAIPGQSVVDPWSTTIYWGDEVPGPIPMVNDTNKAIDGITEWREQIKSPDPMVPLDWSAAKAQRVSSSTTPTAAASPSYTTWCTLASTCGRVCCRRTRSAIHNEVYGRLHLTGSLDAAIMDYADFDEAVIWAEVQRASGSTAPGGSFIPCLTYDGEGSIKLQSAQSR